MIFIHYRYWVLRVEGIADAVTSLIAPVGATAAERRFLLILRPAAANEQAHDQNHE
jgi:hypothetical protein